eukprot:179880_1
MSQFSSSNNYSAPTHSNGGASSSSYPYHHHSHSAAQPTLPSSNGAAPSNLPPAPHKSSSSYSNHRSTSSHHTPSDYSRYHPYSRGETSHTTPSTSHYPPQQSSYHAPTSYYSQQSTSSSYGSHHGSSRYSQSSSNLNAGHRPSSRSFSKPHRSRSEMNLHSSSKKVKAPRNEYGIPFGQPGASLSAPDWASLTLPVFQKNFYRESRAITSQTDPEVLEWRKKKDIVVIGHNVPRPIRTFEEAGFPPYIMAEIARAGFRDPTSIQSQGWPMAMSGRDVIGIAETGSGKTLAFLLPCIVHINAQPLLRPGDGPIVLVIAPTRELAMQIENEVSKFAYSSKIKHCCVYGGVSRREQVRNLRNGVEIVICTPGRLLDFLECGTTNLRRVTYLVIDEADRLLDMGFEPQLSSILSQVRPDRQILMWSATWPKEVQGLSKKYFLSNDVIQVSIGSALSNIKANHNVKQMIDCMDNNYEKQDKLYKLLSGKSKSELFLIFASTKKQCDYLYKMLRSDGFAVCVIHGDKQQYERDEALNSFKTGRNRIMIATDVASRGIHVNNIYMVVNYDFPQNIEDYVHRIGRTGRCGRKGLAVSFFTKSDAKRASKLINILKEAKQEVPPKLVQFQQYGMTSGATSYHRPRYSNYSR